MTISEVSRQFDIPVETLRYYERIGLLRMIPRTASGLRDYNEENCKAVEFIKCMRNAGVTIELLHEYIELLYQGDSTLEARKNLLLEQREILLAKEAELHATIERLNFKIDNYNKLCMGICDCEGTDNE